MENKNKKSAKTTNKNVYVLEHRAVVKVAGREMIDAEYSGIAGVFSSERSAMLFAEKITCALEKSSGRTFTLSLTDDIRDRNRFTFSQVERLQYPLFIFSCLREQVFTDDDIPSSDIDRKKITIFNLESRRERLLCDFSEEGRQELESITEKIAKHRRELKMMKAEQQKEVSGRRQ